MKRNMMKIIEDTQVNPKYEITLGEMDLLKTKYDEDGDMFSLISNLFVYGYAMGMRAEKEKIKRTAKGCNQ